MREDKNITLWNEALHLSIRMMNLSIKSLALRLGLLSFLARARAISQCYYPNGDEASGDTPCYTDGRITHCCGGNSICLTNQLCLSLEQPYGLSRGSCTDQSFGPLCPSYCSKFAKLPGPGPRLKAFIILILCFQKAPRKAVVRPSSGSPTGR